MNDQFDIDIENEENLEKEEVDTKKKYSEAQRKLVSICPPRSRFWVF